MHRCGARTLYPALNKYLVQGKGQLRYGMGTKTHEKAFTIGFHSSHSCQYSYPPCSNCDNTPSRNPPSRLIVVTDCD